MKAFFKFLNDDLEGDFCCVVMTLLSIVLIVQVFFRYVLGQSLVWSEELARYLFVWLVYMGIPYGSKMMRHIKIDAGLMFFPKPLRQYVVIAGDIFFMIVAIIVAALSAQLVANQYVIGLVSPALGVPMWLLYAAPLVGFSLAAIRQLQVVFYRIHLLKNESNVSGADLKI